ncbi:MAG: hypothetical protein FRX49_00171 [Trebouxia sp. A1-2]|nr:MAG: hypothetical protein FRX49_00171 [Trebouxia sp. A1-2]
MPSIYSATIRRPLVLEPAAAIGQACHTCKKYYRNTQGYPEWKALEQTPKNTAGLQPLISQLLKQFANHIWTPPALIAMKHFLALLILAQQTNTGQQSMPAPDEPAAHGNCSPQGLCLGQAMMILISSTDMSAHASDYVIPSSLQMMLTSAAGCQP